MAEQSTFEIEDIKVLEALRSRLRLQILYHLREPHTVRELSQKLDLPVTRLYYHIGLLEDMEVIRVVETRKSGARLQRVYQAVATCYRPGKGLMQDSADKPRIAEVAAGVVLDGARLDAVSGVLAHLEGSERDDARGDLGRTVVRLNPVAVQKFKEKLDQLMGEIETMDDPSGEEFGFSFVFFPTVGPVRGEL